IATHEATVLSAASRLWGSLASHASRALILSMRAMAGVCSETNRQKCRYFKKVRGANEWFLAFGGALQTTLREFRRMSRDVREIRRIHTLAALPIWKLSPHKTSSFPRIVYLRP